MSKYKVDYDGESKYVNEHLLYRVEALEDFMAGGIYPVHKGDKGGWVESEDNLAQEGLCWLRNDACAYEDAKVLDNALVTDRAQAFGSATVSGFAELSGVAKASGSCNIASHAHVGDMSEVTDNALITGNAYLLESPLVGSDAVVSGKARLIGQVLAQGSAKITGSSLVMGRTVVQDNACLSGAVVIDGISSKGAVAFIGGDVKVGGDFNLSGAISLKGDFEINTGKFKGDFTNAGAITNSEALMALSHSSMANYTKEDISDMFTDILIEEGYDNEQIDTALSSPQYDEFAEEAVARLKEQPNLDGDELFKIMAESAKTLAAEIEEPSKSR